MTDDDRPARHWLTLTEAAVKLGISERTARRWLQKGKLSASRIKLPSGFAYRIAAADLPPLQANGVMSDQADKESGQPDSTPLAVDASDPTHHQETMSPRPDNSDQPTPRVMEGDSTRPDSGVSAQSDTSLTALELVSLVREQQIQMGKLHDQIAQLSGQTGFLQAQIQEKDEQLKLLQAPPELPRRRWWRRLWPFR